MKLGKAKKRVSAATMALFLTLSVAPVVSAASNSFLKHYEKATWIKDIGRSFLWDILVLISKILDYVSEAIDVVLGQHLYQDFIAKYLPQSEIFQVAKVIALIAVTFTGVLLIINGDKMHLKDTVKSILIAVTLMAALASMNMINTMSDFQDKVIATTSITAEPDKEGTYHGFGDKLLSYSVYDNVATEKSASGGEENDDKRTQKYLSDSNMSAEGIDINALASPYSEIGRKYDTSIEFDLQYKFSELDVEQMAELVGMSEEYEVLQYLSYGDPNKTQQYYDGSNEKNVDATKAKYEENMITKLSQHPAVVAAGKTDDVKQSKTFVNALNRIKDTVIKDLNIERNEEVYKDSTEIVTKKLRTALDYNKLHWYEQIGVDILEGKGEWESVYRYDFDFFATLVDLLIVTICCIFALLKLCRMLYEIAFMQIFVPLAIASDAHGSGRAKRAVQQLINTFVIMIVVLITLRIYLIVVTQLHTSIDNLVARWGLILAGAHFVIDGSDFIVKMTGMDAGVKSGAATLLGLRSAAGIAKGIGHTAKSVGGTAAHVGSKAAAIGGNAADHIGGAAVGAVGGAIAGAAGGATAGMEGHSSIAGQAVGTTVGLHTGAAVGAVRGGAEGARRGLTGLLGRGRNSGNGQAAESSAAAPSSDGSTASSDTGTVAAPPPTDTDTGTAAPPTASGGADTGTTGGGADTGDTGTAAAPQVDSGSEADTDSGSYDAASNDVQREGSLFTRAYSTGSAVGGVTGHPINKGKQAAYKVGSAKAKFDIAKAGGFKDEKAAVSEKVTEIKYKGRNRIADFVKGKYKDNNDGNGGNS